MGCWTPCHGADYFRRWHRDKANSGGLLVHKSTHHFDLVNWWLADAPGPVYARGGLRFYGERNAARPRLGRTPGHAARRAGRRPVRASTSPPTRGSSALYLDAEHEDGYLRDQNVFGDGVTIEDNMAVLVRYARGATMTLLT